MVCILLIEKRVRPDDGLARYLLIIEFYYLKEFVTCRMEWRVETFWSLSRLDTRESGLWRRRQEWRMGAWIWIIWDGGASLTWDLFQRNSF